MAHFSEEDRGKLAQNFRDLADFIHEHKLEHIVAVGPSATPFARAIARAYRNRHAERLNVIALGNAGEAVGSVRKDAKGVAGPVIQSRLPKTSFLLFDELVSTGRTLANLSKFLNAANLAYKVATLHDGQASLSRHVKLDFVGSVPFGAVSLERSERLATNPLSLLYKWTARRSRAAYLRGIYAELREIADSVERKCSH